MGPRPYRWDAPTPPQKKEVYSYEPLQGRIITGDHVYAGPFPPSRVGTRSDLPSAALGLICQGKRSGAAATFSGCSKDPSRLRKASSPQPLSPIALHVLSREPAPQFRKWLSAQNHVVSLRAKCMQPTSQELCRMRTTLWLGSIWTEDDESSLLISDVQRVPGRVQLAHSQIVFFRVFRVFRCYLKKICEICEICVRG